MSERGAERSIEIAAAPGACFAALLDYESMPEWQDAVKHCEIVERDEEGRGRDVDWRIDAKVRTISYRLRYAYEEPHAIDFHQVEGDTDDVRGSYRIEPHGDGGARVTLSLRVKPGVWVPGRVERMLNGRLMQGALDDLKARAEGAAGAE